MEVFADGMTAHLIIQLEILSLVQLMLPSLSHPVQISTESISAVSSSCI